MSGLRETYVRLQLKDDASSALTRIDNLLGTINSGFASLGTQVDGSTAGFAGMSQEINRLSGRLDVANATIAGMHTEITRSSQEMNELRTTAARLEQELASARQEINQLADGTQDVSNNAQDVEMSFSALGATAAGLAATVGALSFGQTLVQDALEMDEVFGRLQARTGASSEELAAYEGIAKEVFIGGFAGSIGEAADSVSTFNAMFNKLGTSDLTAVVEGAHTISNAWDQEAKQVGKTVATMTKTFEGLSETEALDLITVGFERTADYSDDLLDTFNEYSTQFKALGYDAEGFTATLIAGAESGAFNFNKLADTAKEGFLKMGEGSKDTREALVAMGLDADQVVAGIGKGGETAQKEFMAVSTALASVENPAKRSELAIAAFGTPLEDLGPQFATFFGSVNQDLGNFEGATQRAAEAMQNTFGAKMASAFNELKIGMIDAFKTEGMSNFLGTLATDVQNAIPGIVGGFASMAETISNNVMPAYEGFKKGVSWLIDNKDTIISVGSGLAAGFAVFKGAEMAKGIFDVVKNIGKIGLLSNPIGIAAVAIGGLVTAGVWLYRNFDTVQEKLDVLKENFSSAWNQIKTNVGDAIGQVGGFFTGLKDKAVGLWDTIKQNPMLLSLVGPIGTVIGLGMTLYQNWDTIKAKAGELWTTTVEKFAGIKQAVSNFVQPAIGWFNQIKSTWENFKSSLASFKMPEWVSSIGSKISGAASKIGSLVAGSHATGLASVPYDGYVAELHKGEAVLTAQQSNALRAAGILSGNNNGTPNVEIGKQSGVGLSMLAKNTDKQSMQSAVGGVVPPVTQVAAGSAHFTMPVEVIVHGNADSSTIEQIKASLRQLESSLGSRIDKGLDHYFRRALSGMEG